LPHVWEKCVGSDSLGNQLSEGCHGEIHFFQAQNLACSSVTPESRKMKKILQISNQLHILVIAAFLLAIQPLAARPASSPRTVLSADADWKFVLGDPVGAALQTFDAQSWRTVTVPHDWSIEGTPNEKNPTGGGGGYFPAGIGWYRKTFTAPAAWKGKRVSLEFDGVSSNATVYLNGQKLGTHPYAYTSFRFDITSLLNLSATNVLAVRVDNSEQPNSRWYSGSGIYRHVRVVVTEPVHVAPWGVFVSTPEASAKSATVVLKTEVQNDSNETADLTLRTVLLGPSDVKTRALETKVTVNAGQLSETSQQITLDEPMLWSPGSPRLYRARTQILKGAKLLDEVETSFGVRSLTWSVDKGLLLNGTPIKLAGGSIHHDDGPLGAAAFDRAEERKAELLKAAGFNAVRTAHNPPSPAFLDACDRVGLLVLDEPFDVWTESKRRYDYARFFHDWWQQDIDAMVKRDRNHPSIIMWGIGNEVPEVWTAKGAPIAKELAARVRSLDSTRPLTQAFPGATYGPNPDAAIAQVDIAGYNYNLAQNLPEDHRRVPERIMMTTESFPADAFEQWSLVQDHPFVLGEFVWTAMDYLGESGVGAWSYGSTKQATQMGQMKNFLRAYMAKMGADGKNPMAASQDGGPPNPLFPGFPWHAAYCGDLDLTGFRKPSSYYRDILWNGGDRVFATVRLPETEDKKIIAAGWSVFPTLPSWTWPGQEGKPLTVEVYSGAEAVRLYLNDKLIGEKPTGRDRAFKAEFEVLFTPGILRADGVRAGKVVAVSVLQTAGDPLRLKLAADRNVLDANGQDLAFVTVEAVDEKGRLQINADQKVQFTVAGVGIIAAVGNGDGQSRDFYAGNTFNLFNGRALVVLRTTRKAGSIKLTASAEGLTASSLVVESKSAESLSKLR
jgi:beta-galactosidase